MPPGVALSLVSYLLYSCCDAIIKGFGSGLGVHEIAFWTALLSMIPAALTKPKDERWSDMFKVRHPLLVNLRAVTGVIGNIAVIFAFTTIPLAETYSIAFLAPIFVVALSRMFLKESVAWQRWAFLALTFVGVLIVVRPGFRDLQPGHLTALIAALMGAISTTVLRKVAPVEKRISLLSIPLGYTVIFNGILMLPDFQLPTLNEFLLLGTIGAVGGTSNVIFILASRKAKASQIAPGQYSQILWAILFGALFYKEYPDLVAVVGLSVVVVGGVLNVLSDEARRKLLARLGFGGRPAGAATPMPAADRAPPLVGGDGTPAAGTAS